MLDKEKTTATSRRKLLQSAGTAGAVALGLDQIDFAAAKEEGTHLGKRHFVETVVEHRNVPDAPVVQSDSMPTYTFDDGDLVVLRSLSGLFAENSRIKNVNGKLLPMSERPSVRTGRGLTVETDYQRAIVDQVVIEGQYAPPAIDVRHVGNETIRLATGRNAATTLDSVSAESERTVPLASQTAHIRATAEAETAVEPAVKIRNHGRIDVYDATEGGEQDG